MNFTALDAGFYAQNLYDRVTVAEADKSLVSHFAALLRVRRGFHLGKSFFFEPALSTVLPWYSGVDGSVKTFTFHTDLVFLVPIFSFLRLRAGPGIEWAVTVSSAQAIELNNGTGTSTFYTPGGIRAALTATVRGGLEIKFSRRFSLGADLFVQSAASDARRTIQAAATFGVYL
jgi:hypothetical protein